MEPNRSSVCATLERPPLPMEQAEKGSTPLAGPRLTRHRLPWIFGAAALLFFVIALACCWYTVFSRSMSPDEGYLMITVRSFIEGNALYDTVFTHYGPFYYAYEWVVPSLFSVPLTHDATRMLCILHWLTAAVLLAVAAGRIMKSHLAGLFVFTQAV